VASVIADSVPNHLNRKETALPTEHVPEITAFNPEDRDSMTLRIVIRLEDYLMLQTRGP
jgi:hypothetical protein